MTTYVDERDEMNHLAALTLIALAGCTNEPQPTDARSCEEFTPGNFRRVTPVTACSFTLDGVDGASVIELPDMSGARVLPDGTIATSSPKGSPFVSATWRWDGEFGQDGVVVMLEPLAANRCQWVRCE